jgi:hypothetical protein
MKKRSLGLALMGIALFAAGAATDASAESCVTGFVPFPFQLPDGSIHSGGLFRACTDVHLSPIDSLQRISVSGQVQGLYVARSLQAEAGSVSPFLTFRRRATGNWVLVGITFPSSKDDYHAVTVRLLDRRALPG